MSVAAFFMVLGDYRNAMLFTFFWKQMDDSYIAEFLFSSVSILD